MLVYAISTDWIHYSCAIKYSLSRSARTRTHAGSPNSVSSQEYFRKFLVSRELHCFSGVAWFLESSSHLFSHTSFFNEVAQNIGWIYFLQMYNARDVNDLWIERCFLQRKKKEYLEGSLIEFSCILYLNVWHMGIYNYRFIEYIINRLPRITNRK